MCSKIYVSVFAFFQFWSSALYAQETALSPTPFVPSGPSTESMRSIDQDVSNHEYGQICGAERRFNYFQQICRVHKVPNIKQINDAWLVFRARNIEPLKAIQGVCQHSRRWPVFMSYLAQEEQRASVDWAVKTKEQIESFCLKLPETLSNSKLEDSLHRFAEHVK